MLSKQPVTHFRLPDTATLVDTAIQVGLTLVFGFLALRILFVLVRRVEAVAARVAHNQAHAQQRARTLGQILRNLCSVVVAGAVIIYLLAVFGLDIRPLLAGAGILGVALGFGAQTLVRDVIAGIFILAEDQFAVGDVIEVDGRVATVEGLSVRSTTLRDFNGNLHFVPNGELKIVVNRSRGWSRLAVDVPVAAGRDIDGALDVCEQAAASMNDDPAWRARLLDPVKVVGVENLTGAEAVVRMMIRTKPGGDAADVGRELRRRVVRGLAATGSRKAGQISVHALAGDRNEAAAGPQQPPARPEQPATPTTPARPEQPSTPGQPARPEQPSTPGQPLKPEQPGRPEQPPRPEQPGKPDHERPERPNPQR